MYVVLTGAKQNWGDFLIGHRCKTLLRKYKPEEELISIDSWKCLGSKLDVINNSRGVIIMGGPGYRPNMYPGIYKLVECLDQIQVPIIPLGLGWKGACANWLCMRNYRFSEQSIALLRRISSQINYLSCRDFYTWQVLKNNGFDNALMTGCPSWYELDYIGQQYERPSSIRRIVFTPPIYQNQGEYSVDILRMMLDLFPEADITVCFHQGFEYKRLSGNPDFFAFQRQLRDGYLELGVPCVDLAGNVENKSFQYSFYHNKDLHIGYRVHAHIDFLSRRKTSFLIHEDARGSGVDDALGVPGIKMNANSHYLPVKGRLRRFAAKLIFSQLFVDQQEPSKMLRFLIEREMQHGFSSFVGLGERIDYHFNTMVNFLCSF